MINRITKLLLIVLPLIATGKAWGQCNSSDQWHNYEIGTSTSLYCGPSIEYTSRYTSVSEYIFTKEELAEIGITAGTIKAISFQSRTSVSRNMTFYMAHTDKFCFNTSNRDPRAYIKSGLTKVYGPTNVSWGSSGWTDITFTTNFEYNGSQNLLIVAIDNTNSTASSVPTFVSGYIPNPIGYQSIHGNNSSSGAMTINNDSFTTSLSPNICTYRPNMRFKVSALTCSDVPILNRSIWVTSSTAQISWTGGETVSEWEIKYGEPGFNPGTQGTTISASTNPITLTGLTANHGYEVCVRSVCGSCKSGYSSKIFFRTLPTSGNCGSGEGVSRDIHGDYSPCGDINSYGTLPIYSENNYAYSQTIYTKQDVAVGEGTIVGITYHQLTDYSITFNSGKLKIYMGTTTNDYFGSTSFIEGLTLVYSNTSAVTFTKGMNYIPLSTTFEYDGTKNIVVAFSDERGSKITAGGIDYYCSKSSGHKTLLKTNSSAISLPTTGGYQDYYPRVIFNICSAGPFCSQPIITNIEAINSTATVTWERGVEGFPDHYNIRYRIVGESDWVTITSNTNSVTLEHLLVDNTYEVQVQSACTNSLISEWSPLETFSECGAKTLPYLETFSDTYSGGIYPWIDCWTPLAKRNIIAEYEYTTGVWDGPYISTSDKCLYLAVNSTRGYYVSTPEISVGSLSDCTLSFDLKTSNSSGEYLYVGVMDDPNDISTYTNLHGYNNTNTSYQHITLDLSGYSGTGKYLTFKTGFTTNSATFYIDNIKVNYTSAEDCNSPIEVGTSTYVSLEPISYYGGTASNKYTYSNQIYLASEIGGAGTIYGIWLYSNTSISPTIYVYMGHTNNSTVTTTLVGSGNLRQCGYSYSLTSGWNYISFTTPFDYNGTDNLLVAISFYVSTRATTHTFRYSTTSSAYRAVYCYGSSYNLNASPTTGTRTYNRPNIKFEMTVCSENACHPPYDFVARVSCPNVNLSWTAPSLLTSPKYTIYRDGTQIATNLTTTSYTDNNAPSGNHTYTIKATSTTPSCTTTTAMYTVYGINCCERLTAPSIGVTRGDRQVVVNWGTSADASSYTLYYGVNTPNPSIDNVWKVTGLTNQSSPYTVLRLTNGQTYKFAVMPVGTGRYCTDNPLSEIKEATPNCQ